MAKKERIFPIETVGGRIQHLMNKRNLSRIDLYNAVFPDSYCDEISKNRTVYNWFSGKTELDYAGIIALCKILNSSVDYILGMDTYTNKTTNYICTETGLSETAVELLQTHNKPVRRVTEKMLSIINQLLTKSRLDEMNRIFFKHMQIGQSGANGTEKTEIRRYYFDRQISDLFREILYEKEVYNAYARDADLLSLDIEEMDLETEMEEFRTAYIKYRYGNINEANMYIVDKFRDSIGYIIRHKKKAATRDYWQEEIGYYSHTKYTPKQ